MPEMISVEQARDLVLSHVSQLPAETVPVLDAAGRVAAVDLKSDIDISPFANSAMDGYAVRSADLAQASGETPVTLDVIGHEAAGHVFEGVVGTGEELPSHRAVERYIARYGTDYRYERRASVLGALQNRRRDDLSLARGAAARRAEEPLPLGRT